MMVESTDMKSCPMVEHGKSSAPPRHILILRHTHLSVRRLTVDWNVSPETNGETPTQPNNNIAEQCVLCACNPSPDELKGMVNLNDEDYFRKDNFIVKI